MKKISKTVGIFILGVVASFAINVAAEAVISSGAVSYSNTTVSAALDELFSAVDINNKIGTTDISTIGDGTITGALETVNNNLSKELITSSSELSVYKQGGFLYLYVYGASIGEINAFFETYSELRPYYDTGHTPFTFWVDVYATAANSPTGSVINSMGWVELADGISSGGVLYSLAVDEQMYWYSGGKISNVTIFGTLIVPINVD